MMRVLSYIIVLIIIITGVTFAAINANPVAFHYGLGERQLSLSILLVYALGIGIILGALALLPLIIKLKHEHRRLKKQAKEVEQEINNLRNIPIKDNH